MSVWIRAICTQSLGTLTVDELAHGTQSADFLAWAEAQGLSPAAGVAARDTLRFMGPPGPLSCAALRYRDGYPIGIERLTGEKAAQALHELLEGLEGEVDTAAQTLRAQLYRGVELVAFELMPADAQGMGWPIAWQTAMWLAGQAKGVVEADGTWWDPEAYVVLRSSLL
jgi:hypothetical protein